MSQIIRPLSIIGTGIFLPPRSISSSEIDSQLGKPEGFAIKLSAPQKRYFVDEVTTSSEMAAKACLAALGQANISPNEIDLIISASSVTEQPIPTQAVLISRHLGLSGSGIPAYDINATCLSFLAAIDTISDAIVVGRYKKVLIVSSEILSRGLNWKDPASSVIFGDGAAAAILSYEPRNSRYGIIASKFETFCEGADLCQLRTGGTATSLEYTDFETYYAGKKYQMDGVAAYKLTAQLFPAFLSRLMVCANLSISDIDLVIPHQASRLALDHLISLINIPTHKLIDIYADYGNQASVSIPNALHHALISGKLKDGMKVLLAGTGAGITFGGIIMRV
ncbi:MAG: 3-oxoacyl-[acyl-carrier-protein] synthase III C-terminal domain-containing protein [Pseudomonadota bacterium]